MVASTGADAEGKNRLRLVRIAAEEVGGTARVVVDEDEDRRARYLLLEKYGPRSGGDLTSWGETALPVAVDLVAI